MDIALNSLTRALKDFDKYLNKPSSEILNSQEIAGIRTRISKNMVGYRIKKPNLYIKLNIF